MRITVNGAQLFFEVVGTRLRFEGTRARTTPSLIVLHGGPGFDHSGLRNFCDRFADIAQVIYLDHRGNGRSGGPGLCMGGAAALRQDRIGARQAGSSMGDPPYRRRALLFPPARRRNALAREIGAAMTPGLARLEILEQCHHGPYREEPVRCEAILREFIARVPAS